MPMRRISEYTLSNYIRNAFLATFLQQDPFEERIIVSQHEAFIHSTPMGSLQFMEVGFMNSNGFFKLLQIHFPTFSEKPLGLTMVFIAFLGSSIFL
jgi:hypothetical protein